MTNEPLTSWKAIAAVFGRDVRTVQRWEKEEGLPVHRHLHHRRHSVWANREDLEAWWQQRGPTLRATEPDGLAEIDTPGDSATTTNPGLRGRRPVLRYVVIGALAVTLAAAGSMSAWRSRALSYAPAISLIDIMPGASPIEVTALRDLNGDSLDDALVHRERSNEIDIYFGPRQGRLPQPDVRITVPGPHPVYATSVGDVDGDGLRDLIVSVMYDEPDTYHATGPSYLLRGRTQWPPSVDLPRDADATLRVKAGPDIRLIACGAGDGVDLNADGLADVVLGGADYSTPNLRSPGGVFVLWGRRAWPADIDVVAAADVTLTGSYDGHGLTPWCAPGDFNGDGLTDLALVATDAPLWYLRGGRGGVFVFEGRTVWPRRLDAVRDAMFAMSATTSTIWAAHPRLVDVNGDGADDLVAAMAAADEHGSGRVAIAFGGRERKGLTENDADVVIRGASQFGYALATADVDADGRFDLIVADRHAETVFVIPGRREWPRRGPTSGFSAAVFKPAGTAIGRYGLAVGDADGDGAFDIAFGVGTQAVGLLKPGLPLSVDVRPNGAPNVLVAGGVVSIAVWLPDGIEEDLDVSSLRVAGIAPSQLAASSDRNGVQIYFEVDRLRLRPGATRLSVIGRTRSGIPVSGSDAIVIAAPGQSAAR